MNTLRAFIRLACILFVLCILVAIFGVGLIFCFPKYTWRLQLKNILISAWAVTVSHIMGLKMHVQGVRPAPPFLLVSNHLSYLDILPFWRLLKTTFIAKSEIQGWPIIGWLARLFGIIFINRTNNRDLQRVNAIIEDQINEVQGVILFPEGTSSKGEEVLPFKSSLLHYAASRNRPVYHATISYKVTSKGSYKAWSDVCWWGDMDFVSHFWKLLHIKSTECFVNFGRLPIKNNNRKILAKELHQKVEEQFLPVYQR